MMRSEKKHFAWIPVLKVSFRLNREIFSMSLALH